MDRFACDLLMNQFSKMKACQSSFSAALIFALALAVLPRLAAQEVLGSEKVVSAPISTGSVVSVDRPNALIVIQSAETQAPITFYGMNKARVETKSGRLATFEDVQPKMPVTVYYTPVEGRWYVGRVLIPDTQAVPVPAGSELTAAEQKALNSKAANDGDITTKPGVKARIDGDITTKPGKKDPRDPDITKKSDK
jgi:hypothetical protein